MIRCYIPVDQRNKKRVWPCKALSGIVITVPCDRVTMTREDLTSHVRSGLLIELESIQEPDIDQPVDLDSIGIASDVVEVIAPVVVAREAAPVIDTVVVPDGEHSVEVAAEAEAEASSEADGGFDAMTRSELWALIVARGLDGGGEYRSTTKSKMISILTEG